MGEPDHRTEPRVSRDELRGALEAASAPRPRANPLVSAAVATEPEPEGAWDWSTGLDEAERSELERLRAGDADRQARIAELEAGAERERALSAALRRLAGASLLKRRGVIAELRASGLLAPAGD
jgi:hypothetical protein